MAVTKEVEDPLGDADVPYDIVRVTYTNTSLELKWKVEFDALMTRGDIDIIGETFTDKMKEQGKRLVMYTGRRGSAKFGKVGLIVLAPDVPAHPLP